MDNASAPGLDPQRNQYNYTDSGVEDSTTEASQSGADSAMWADWEDAAKAMGQ